MTIRQAMEELEYLQGSTVKQETVISWLSRLDGLVNRQLHRGRSLYREDFAGYAPDTDPDTELLVPPPYDGVYGAYLARQLYDVLGEIPRSNNAAARYNAILAQYMDDLTRRYPVESGQKLKLV